MKKIHSLQVAVYIVLGLFFIHNAAVDALPGFKEGVRDEWACNAMLLHVDYPYNPLLMSVL